MPAVPDPMIFRNAPPVISLLSHCLDSLNRRLAQAALILAIACGMFVPDAVTAGGTQAAALDKSQLGETGEDAGAEELKKQAQAAYLAAKFKKQEAAVRKYVDLAWAEASKRDWLAPELLIAIMQKESALRPKIQNRYGAQGLMQVVRRWHHDKLQPSESLFDPEVNIRVGADVLEEYLALADGNLDTALRKYSGNARGYANTIRKESRALARVAERAASKATLAQG